MVVTAAVQVYLVEIIDNRIERMSRTRSAYFSLQCCPSSPVPQIAQDTGSGSTLPAPALNFLNHIHRYAFP